MKIIAFLMLLAMFSTVSNAYACGAHGGDKSGKAASESSEAAEL